MDMPDRLLDRQASLLDYLRSEDAIFGERKPAAIDPSLDGIDDELLRIEARFSYEKRMTKIQVLLPRTFELLAGELEKILREFNRACPPSGISSFENARRFYQFLSDKWLNDPPRPPYLPDVAAYEIACAGFRRDEGRDHQSPAHWAPQGSIRRHPEAVLLRCAYDVQPIFAAVGHNSAPVMRDTPLAITMAPKADQTMVLELLPSVFDLLTLLDDYTDPAALGETRSDAHALAGLIADLAALGLLEVHG
jgi:hypothetical protein